MRVSSGMIFDAGVAGINRNTSSLLHLQQQISSNRRILTPSDDPVAAARALEVQQASDVVAQFSQNRDAALYSLGLEEGQLDSATGVLSRVRELAIQAGGSSLTASQRQVVSIELRSRFNELLGIANASDGSGQHIFSGFMGATTPFSGAVDNLLAGNEIVYQGDEGQRTLQVSPGRLLEVSDSGVDVFLRIRDGNGYFAADYASSNTGAGAIAVTTVTDPSAWTASATKNVAINFTVTGPVTTYDLVNTATGNSLLTGAAAPAPTVNQRVFQSGQPIVLKSQGSEPVFDLGGSLVITGAPGSGDNFSVTPSASQSVFATVAKLIGALEAPVGTPGADAKYLSEINFAVSNLDRASGNILRVRAQIGSRMNEISSLDDLNANLQLQYQQTLSGLQDVDLAKAISDLTRKQTDLQAAQQSFVNISRLSLFNFL
ncbi:MAG: flagellar hook-associated protein FlgL [Rugosibacter sp.]|nr:flagellar hook-associated protein FlgL [Rugosibacter sp.]